ncbi:MAG TPA: methylenetetrahydromethanopterin dehydrogenase, partial [Candidatus Polarisedimenticolia bacterium]|nr:methylenetetrahydromethanopterin dehydrogenase [Candidatus Polarisedimenticolia bacterium]
DVRELFGAAAEPRATPGAKETEALAAEADILLATGAAGVRFLSSAQVSGLRGPKVLADVNAVPPSGIEGLEAKDDDRELASGVFGLGALAVGGLKSKIEASLLRDLATSEKPLLLDASAAGTRAAEILAGA